MTLTLALKTDKEVYLASDSRSHFETVGGTEFKSVHKYVKINDHVEVLISGILDLGLGFIEDAIKVLRRKSLDIESYDASDIADEIEREIVSTYDRYISKLSEPSVKAALIKSGMEVSDYLKEQWLLEIIVGGMDKDMDGNFTYPAIYVHVPGLDYVKCKSDWNVQLGGAPSIVSIAETYMMDMIVADTLDSSINYEDRIYSCFQKTIREIEQQMAENESPTVGAPIHIARITKERYETLR